MNIFNAFKNKTVLITGHTGFKGTWLSIWLESLGAKVVGISDEIPTTPSHFLESGIKSKITDYRFDILNAKRVDEVVRKENPDYIFHLAAQAIVKKSYVDPLRTWNINVIGTANLLDALRSYKKKCSVILVTSDKCYDNKEWDWGYREIDRLGGPDPYSGSKGAAELVISSYVRSYFPRNGLIRVAVGRAGNVVGGGDWACDRLVPDCVRAWGGNEVVQIRRPNATRPWQHVLEPLSGYINLANMLSLNSNLHGEAFNFGPSIASNHSVIQFVKQMSLGWKNVKWIDVSENYSGPHESGLLNLNCDKAFLKLGWRSTLNFEETIQYTTDWYQQYYKNPSNMIELNALTLRQIGNFTQQAMTQKISWANNG